MLFVLLLSMACFGLSLLTASPIKRSAIQSSLPLPKEVWILYIGSWGNPETDGNWSGWDHSRDNWAIRIPPADLASVHYPVLGPYSSHNLAILRDHLRMLHDLSVDVVVVPWSARSIFSDQTLVQLFKAAPEFSIRILPLFEAYMGRNLTSLQFDYATYIANYVRQKAQYRRNGQPVGIVYDAQDVQAGAEFLMGASEMRFMATSLSRAHYLGAFEAGFLGFVTYFPSDDIGWASNHENWNQIAEMSADRGIEFVPTVSPGFNNSAINRWGFRALRSRQCSAYYDARWGAAIAEGTRVVMIHSFNSWSEGTAIEPVAERVTTRSPTRFGAARTRTSSSTRQRSGLRGTRRCESSAFLSAESPLIRYGSTKLCC
jgi:glycoprotein endo-alpha-1,2-mannosidase